MSILIGVIVIILGVGLVLAGLSIRSRHAVNNGLVDGRLQACGSRPNCVCSEDLPGCNYEPIPIAPSHYDQAWQAIQDAIIKTGGSIQTVTDHYLWATYSTPWLKFIDDFELRLDTEQSVIHVRSASRVGYSDLGQNRKRMDQVVATFLSEHG